MANMVLIGSLAVDPDEIAAVDYNCKGTGYNTVIDGCLIYLRGGASIRSHKTRDEVLEVLNRISCGLPATPEGKSNAQLSN